MENVSTEDVVSKQNGEWYHLSQYRVKYPSLIGSLVLGVVTPRIAPSPLCSEYQASLGSLGIE
jgi:hypothetical protein